MRLFSAILLLVCLAHLWSTACGDDPHADEGPPQVNPVNEQDGAAAPTADESEDHEDHQPPLHQAVQEAVEHAIPPKMKGGQKKKKIEVEDLQDTEEHRDCGVVLNAIWTTQLRGSKVTATPILYDIDQDGFDDIIVTTAAGEVWAVHGETGHVIDNWPFHIEGKGFHSSPLLYDIDADGHDEIVAVTSDAEIVFISQDASIKYGETIKLSPIKVDRKWYLMDEEEQKKIAEKIRQQMKITGDEQQLSMGQSTKPYNSKKPQDYVEKFGKRTDILYSKHTDAERPSGVDREDSNIVWVDPHVLGTPVITDTNGDGLENEMVLSLSYYFDNIYYGDPHNLDQLGMQANELPNFVGGGLVNIDLTTGKIIWQTFFGLTHDSTDQPGFVIASPTAIKADTGEGFDILVGTAKGEVHFLNGKGEELAGFPLSTDSIAAQIVVGDLDADSVPDIVVFDESGNILVLEKTGGIKWEYNSGTPIAGSPRLGDVDNDGKMDIVIAARDGTLFFVTGALGVPKPTISVMGTRVEGQPLLTFIHSDLGDGMAVVLPSAPSHRSVAHIHFYNLKKKCKQALEIERGSYVSPLAGNIVPSKKGIEYLVSLQDGTLVCYSFHGSLIEIDQKHRSNIWPSEVHVGSGFTHKSNSLTISPISPNLEPIEITGRHFEIEFEITYGGFGQIPEIYLVELSMGRAIKLHRQYISIGTQVREVSVKLDIKSPSIPISGQVHLKVCSPRYECDEFYYNMRFNLHFEAELKWCLAVPFICLCMSILWFIREEKTPASLPLVTEDNISDSRKDN